MSKDLERVLSERRWFHSIDVGEFATSGRFKPGEPQNITLYGFMDLVKDMDLKGMTVLDVGAADGLASFGMKALGAEAVHSTNAGSRHNFQTLHDILGMEGIEYYDDTQVKDLMSIFNRGQFDLILCAGVIYHMLNPVSAFSTCRKLIKDGGLFILETPCDRHEERAAIFINSETEMLQEKFTYSIPSKAALIALMKLFSFEVLAIRTLKSPYRVTVLAQAVAPNQISDKTEHLRRIHAADFCDHEFSLARDLSSNRSSIVPPAHLGDEVIDPTVYEPRFPFHPPRDKPVVGSTSWSTPEGNR